MPRDGYRRRYSLRKITPLKSTLEVTFPYEEAEVEARRQGLSLKDLLQQFQLVAHFGDGQGVLYTFARKETR